MEKINSVDSEALLIGEPTADIERGAPSLR